MKLKGWGWLSVVDCLLSMSRVYPGSPVRRRGVRWVVHEYLKRSLFRLGGKRRAWSDRQCLCGHYVGKLQKGDQQRGFRERFSLYGRQGSGRVAY